MLKSKKGLLLISSAVIFAQSTNALAADLGTDAGKRIDNTASVTYQVGSTTQPTVNSNTEQFLVDRKVNLTVVEANTADTTTTLNPSTPPYTTFTVTNKTNGPLDFRLVGAQLTTGGTIVRTGGNETDTFNMASIAVYVDSNGNNTYDPGVDTATYIDELGEDQSRTVFIVGTPPTSVGSGVANGGIAGVTLTAIAAAPASTVDPVTGAITTNTGALGADLTNDSGSADVKMTVQNVFADAAANGDAGNNGQAIDDDGFALSAPVVSVVKSSRVVEDTVNGTTNPKAIPGATVEYCIAVKNEGSAAATSINISDTIPANTTFVTGSLTTEVAAPGGVCDSNSAGTTTGVSTTGSPTVTSISGSIATVAAGSVATPSYVALRFRVTIN